MNKHLRKSGAIMASLLLATSLFAGCGNNNSSSGNNNSSGSNNNKASDVGYELDPNTPAWQLDNEKPTTLTWYVNVDWWNSSYGTDFVTKHILEDTNITIEFRTGDDTKLNTMFASSDLTDIITIMDAGSQLATQANTWAYALNDLADQYDPYFYKVATEDVLNWHSLSDGKTYCYPNYANSTQDYESNLIKATTAFTIRSDVYEALGQPSMKTQDEFLSVLGQIKEQFPNLTPFGWNNTVGTITWGLQDYIGVPVDNADGSYLYRNLNDDYLSWIRTLNQAHSNGYISDDLFADDATTFGEKVQTGKYACLFIDGTPQLANDLQIFMGSNPDAKYIAIDGPESTIGNEPLLSQSGPGGWMKHYVSNSSKNAQKAIQLFTYLLSDYGEVLCFYGVEGETYTINGDGLYQFTDEILDMKYNDTDMFNKTYRFSEFYLFGHDRYYTMSADVTESIVQMQEWGEGKLSSKHFLTTDIKPAAGTQEARNLTNIETYWETTIVSLIRAASDSDFDKILTDYNQFLSNNGWDAVVSSMSENMKTNRQKLGW